MSYSSIGILAIILHVIINADVMFGKIPNEDRKVFICYRRFLYATLVFYILDAAWGLFADLNWVMPSMAVTQVFFLTMGIMVFLWMRYILAFLMRKYFWTSLLKYSSVVLLIILVIVLIVNIFVPVIFYFEPNGDYVPLLGRRILFDIQTLLFAIIAVYTLLVSKSHEGRERTQFIAVGLSGLLMALLIIVQLFYPLLPFYSIGLMIATSVIHSFVVVDAKIESNKKIGSYMRAAYKDPLTQVRNQNAYSETKAALDDKLKNGKITELGVVVFDLNNLKQVNDTLGHDAGDKYIKDSCMLICHTFKHSPVFRIGGDEFIAILQKEDYENRATVFEKFNSQVEANTVNGGPVVAAGMSIFVPEKDKGYDTIFERADALMYMRKKELKQRYAGPIVK